VQRLVDVDEPRQRRRAPTAAAVLQRQLAQDDDVAVGAGGEVGATALGARATRRPPMIPSL
jgi:hypothetical protein